jgi:hypothetical protein
MFCGMCWLLKSNASVSEASRAFYASVSEASRAFYAKAAHGDSHGIRTDMKVNESNAVERSMEATK